MSNCKQHMEKAYGRQYTRSKGGNQGKTALVADEVYEMARTLSPPALGVQPSGFEKQRMVRGPVNAASRRGSKRVSQSLQQNRAGQYTRQMRCKICSTVGYPKHMRVKNARCPCPSKVEKGGIPMQRRLFTSADVKRLVEKLSLKLLQGKKKATI